jgi:putative hydrolase of HD superfamily
MTQYADAPQPITFEEITDLVARLHALKELPRTGWVMHEVPDPESVADHSFGVALLVMVCARRMRLDAGKAVMMAVLHDLAESLVGDITPADGMTPSEKSAVEERATRAILDGIDDSGTLVDLWLECQNCSSPEGALVHELDRLEMAFQADRYERTTGRLLAEFFPYVGDRVHTPDLVDILDGLLRAREHRHRRNSADVSAPEADVSAPETTGGLSPT